MTRDEFVWVVVRAIGVLTLWLLFFNMISFLVYFPTILINAHNFTPASISITGELYVAAARAVVELVVYGFLSFYLLRRGRLVFNLILKNIPKA